MVSQLINRLDEKIRQPTHDLSHLLKSLREFGASDAELKPFLEAYHGILERCGVNSRESVWDRIMPRGEYDMDSVVRMISSSCVCEYVA